MASSSSHSTTRTLTSTIFHHSSPTATTTATTATTTTTATSATKIPTALFATRRSSRACIVPRPTRGVCSPTGARTQNPSFTRRNYSRRTTTTTTTTRRSQPSSSTLHNGIAVSTDGFNVGGIKAMYDNIVTSSSLSSSTTKNYSTTSTTLLQASNNNNNDNNNNDNEISSSRGRNAVSLLPVYLTDARAVTKYDPIHAPDGALQLSVAENQMLEDLLVPAIRTFATTTKEDEEEHNNNNNVQGLFHSDQIYYQPTHGRESLRQAMSGYLHKILKLKPTQTLDVDGMVLGAGCNAVLENLCFCLTEPGDGVLLPTPYYAAFEFDLVARAGLKIIPVQTMKYNGGKNVVFTANEKSIPQSSYYPNVTSLNAAYDQAKAVGAEPKVLLLSHPNNPLGICYPPSVIEECVNWAREKKIHLISDEIYAGSVYRKTNPLTGEDTFQSALTIAANAAKTETSNEDNKTGLGLGPYIHFVYALSKDFALSGLRVGVAYSENEAIRLPMQKLNDLCQISSQTQQTVEHMLSSGPLFSEDNDDDKLLWATDEFLPQNNERIKSRSDRVQLCLDECDIPCLFGDSGLFLWMDMTEFLPPLSDATNPLMEEEEESEESKDARERALYLELLQEYGLLFTPGRSMRNEYPGFFRIVFTAASDEEFDLGLERIKAYVKAKRDGQ